MTNNIPFKDFNLSPALLDSIEKCGFTTASAIQELTIDPILEGKDILALAETGSGKTASFAIPIIEHIIHDDLVKVDEVHYVVLSPTRELAQQTEKVFNDLGKDSGIKTVCVIGGESLERQKEQISKGAHIIVATPGRLVDLLKQKAVLIDRTYGIVFDEADRLFDMGFQKDVEYTLGQMPDDRQLIMVSATTNMAVLNTAYKFNSTPIELKLNEDNMVVDHIDHKLAMINANEKMGLLVSTIRNHEDAYALVFCNTKFQTHLVAEWLIAMNFKAKAISGGLSQSKRTKLIKDFRSKETTILVCTDVAARGLDIKDVNLVINYDLPQDAANYVHRIGRTGRAGSEGEAISFCSFDDCEYLDPIQEFIGDKIPKLEIAPEDISKQLSKKPFIDRKTFKVVDRATGKPLTQEEKDKRKKPQRKPKKKAQKRVDTNTVTEKSISKPVAKIEKKPSTPTFTIQTDSQESAKKAALAFFKIKHDSQLNLDESTLGRKKYFLFGKRLTKFTYSLRPTYKKIVMPFIIALIKKTGLKLFAKFSFNGKNIKVFFSGADEKMLTKDNNELLQALEHLTRLHLYNSVKVPREVRLNFKCKGLKNQEDSLIKMVERETAKVLDSREPVTLKALNASDRRLVHQHLDKHKEVKTVSIGEGRMKKIQITLA
ncbi:DEAD/DEAH box helicase [Bacteriovorax sp. BAL6_X]|uniref:DEAD/DEAH box helicase n=1 Tax=Bacteriovorax sp. BAL6_X TaxID=1201290 RepID=UPI0003859747|nr:DEAD/DEAH box helicase [Bacteriovorax sp. BAL6_X]EPZ50152.1 DEAD/DEAH box helicase [Bacteriovorax sp. BAL6_X]